MFLLPGGPPVSRAVVDSSQAQNTYLNHVREGKYMIADGKLTSQDCSGRAAVGTQRKMLPPNERVILILFKGACKYAFHLQLERPVCFGQLAWVLYNGFDRLCIMSCSIFEATFQVRKSNRVYRSQLRWKMFFFWLNWSVFPSLQLGFKAGFGPDV